MLFHVCLLAAAQIAGNTMPGSDVSMGKPRAAEQRPVSLPQAQARMVARFNALVTAMQDFSNVYNGTHSVNARKAKAVRRAWKEFEAAESQCRKLNER